MPDLFLVSNLGGSCRHTVISYKHMNRRMSTSTVNTHVYIFHRDCTHAREYIYIVYIYIYRYIERGVSYTCVCIYCCNISVLYTIQIVLLQPRILQTTYNKQLHTTSAYTLCAYKRIRFVIIPTACDAPMKILFDIDILQNI